jgi:septum formation protein
VIPVTLASQSAIRASLLRAAGVVVSTASPGVDEEAVKAELADASPREIAVALADRKALALTGRRDGLVIGADQTLEFDGLLFDKAADLEEARTRLMMLRGKTHQLHAAVAVAQGGKVIWRDIATVSLTMRPFSDRFLAAYLAGNEGALSSVGCYQLEGEGAQLFSAIQGDYFAILGLPLFGLLDCLRREGALTA